VSHAPVRIEPMRRRHLAGVLRIERRVYPKPWSFSLYAGELALPESNRFYRVARSGGRVVGYGGLMFVPDEAHVTTLAVHPGHQRERIGARLMLVLAREAVSRGMEGLTLEVRMSNEPARALYRRFGFAPAGVRQNYYAEVGEDALVMWAHDIGGEAYRARLDAIEADLPPAEVLAVGA
jgi:[ribosomal protein S18]-alanine N-acetyltransferase